MDCTTDEHNPVVCLKLDPRINGWFISPNYALDDPQAARLAARGFWGMEKKRKGFLGFVDTLKYYFNMAEIRPDEITQMRLDKFINGLGDDITRIIAQLVYDGKPTLPLPTGPYSENLPKVPNPEEAKKTFLEYITSMTIVSEINYQIHPESIVTVAYFGDDFIKGYMGLKVKQRVNAQNTHTGVDVVITVNRKPVRMR